jgi:methionyl-tRNA formyltransferase
MNALKVIFMGTPDFAVPSLEILLKNNINVVAVITAPDKPQGRGQKVRYSPVKECALKNGIPVLQPTNLKHPDFLSRLDEINANLQVVVAFRMLPEVVWSRPAFGTFNLHASLLPQYRGAAPINWAIINGETETGVTTFFLRHQIDTGNIIFQEKELISDTDNAGMLHDRLMIRGAELVLKTIKAIETGQSHNIPQKENGELKHAPKIFKETCEINWDQPGARVRNFIRGLSPHPGAWTSIHGRIYKIYDGEILSLEEQGSLELEPGQFKTDNHDYLWFKTKDELYSVTRLQPEGKKQMDVKDFFRGNKLQL